MLFGILGVGVLPVFLSAITINGFVVDDTAVPVEHLVRAAPAKDSINSINDPNWVSLTDCDFLETDDELISITIGEETRAYPLRILVWHEIVNDTFGEQAVALTHSALTGSAVAFNRAKTPMELGANSAFQDSSTIVDC